MCTMTWMFRNDGYELFFNRDEAHTRLLAFPPEVRTVEGVSFIAPIDADAGGTWMGVNQFGLSVCLLNGYGRKTPGKMDYTSRGLLVLSLLDCTDQQAIGLRIAALNMVEYKPFTLVAFEPEKSVKTWAWNGTDLRVKEEVCCPLISSSFRLTAVADHRRHLFDALRSHSAKALTDFHRSHVPEAGPFSVCMHRDDAQTVSLSRVAVTSTDVDFHYVPGPPCQTNFLPPLFLPRIPVL